MPKNHFLIAITTVPAIFGTMSENESTKRLDFIREIVAADTKSGKWDGRVITRFPPEPNGYLHIGHAKAFCLDFGIAAENKGTCHLRFDDTNPTKEDTEYVDSIMEDIKWLGWDWGQHLYYASDYFEQMYEYAVGLIKAGKAYVCDLTADQTRQYRGPLTSPGKDSPYRQRSIEENLDLFAKMRSGALPEGACTLKAKIDMASANLNMRDPVIYRILHTDHHRTGSKWSIYPTYDWAHGLEDSIEHITHSLCTLEFENHRPLYDWYLNELGVYHPQQIEFAPLNLTYTIMSKRKLRKLVEENLVNGWDDPRMPTLSGLRKRGYSPESIKNFCATIGVNKFNSTVDIELLEHCLRKDLNKTSARVMAVLNPVKVIINNYPEDESENLEAINNPEDPAAGSRQVPFSRELYIERDDFMEEPVKKFFRLAPGREVRLRYAYFITCTNVVKDSAGRVTEIHCTYDPTTRGGDAPDGRKVKATIHWVNAKDAIDAEVRLYDHLFITKNPDETKDGADFTSNLNHDSCQVLTGCKLEPTLKDTKPLNRYQFERLGYFCCDTDSTKEMLIFNRTASLRDTWAKIQKSQKNKKGK
jgi:glutaminyl-tRNA synthetase